MGVLPTARISVVCRAAVPNADGSWTLHEPLSTITPNRGGKKGYRLPSVWVYSQLSDGDGVFNLSVEMWTRDTGSLFEKAPVVRSDVTRQTFPHRLTVVEYGVEFTEVPFPRPGLYEFRVLADGRAVGDNPAFLRVL